MIQAIVYTSQTGHTEEYAHLLSEATGLPAYPLQEAEAALPGGTEVAYFGWVMANSVQGYRKASKRFSIPMLSAVGMAAPGTTDQDIRQRNTIPEDVALFTLQGDLRLDKLRGLHRLMMRMMVASARKTLMEKKASPAEEWTAIIDTKNKPRRRIAQHYAALLRISNGVRPFFISMRW